MKHEIHIPAHSALWIIEVLEELEAFIADPKSTTDLRTFKTQQAIQTLQRALKPLERSIRAEVARLHDDAELPF